jgi:hypothetical protein
MIVEVMPGWQPAPGTLCAKCGTSPAGPGGILCLDCRTGIEATNRRLAGREEQGDPQA